MLTIKSAIVSLIILFGSLNATTPKPNIAAPPNGADIAQVTDEIANKTNLALTTIMNEQQRGQFITNFKAIAPKVISNQTQALDDELATAPNRRSQDYRLALKHAKASSESIKKQLKESQKQTSVTETSLNRRGIHPLLKGTGTALLVLGSAALVIMAFILLSSLVRYFLKVIHIRRYGPVGYAPPVVAPVAVNPYAAGYSAYPYNYYGYNYYGYNYHDYYD